MKRSQGTVSGLINNPPSLFPTSTGREPWKAMMEFLLSKTKQDEVSAAQVAHKGKMFGLCKIIFGIIS